MTSDSHRLADSSKGKRLVGENIGYFDQNIDRKPLVQLRGNPLGYDQNALASKSSEIEDKAPWIEGHKDPVMDIWTCYNNLTDEELKQLDQTEIIQMLTTLKKELRRPNVSKIMIKIYNDIESRAGQIPNTWVCNIMLSMYVQLKDLESCKKQFNYMEALGIRADTVTYNTMISAHGRFGMLDDVIRIYDSMVDKNIKRTKRTYMAMIEAYTINTIKIGKKASVEKAMEIFQKFETDGLGYDEIAFNAIIQINVKALAPNFKPALLLFEKMKSTGITPTVTTYNILIRGMSKCGAKEKAMELFHQMKDYNIKPDGYTLAAVDIKNLNALKLLKRTNRDMTVNDYNGLICQAIRGSDWIQAFKIFQDMRENGYSANIKTYTMLIEAHIKNQDIEQSMELYKAMREEGIKPDIYIYSALIRAGLMMKSLHGVTELIDLMIKDDVTLNTVTLNEIIQVASRFGDFELVETIYRKMQDKGVLADLITFKIILYIGAQHRSDVTLKKYLREMRDKYHLTENNEIYQAIIIGYCGAKKGSDAVRWYLQMKQNFLEPTRLTLSALIEICSKNLDTVLVLKLWNEMLELNHKPDGLDIQNVFQVIDRATSALITEQLKALGRGEIVKPITIHESVNSLSIENSKRSFQDDPRRLHYQQSNVMKRQLPRLVHHYKSTQSSYPRRNQSKEISNHYNHPHLRPINNIKNKYFEKLSRNRY
ncbi:hypothetical protein G9A89_001520 [Geosiphon pyriformis]|nr:hypothetical protein G9A89_001520 [Geosiphon pyriformis]